MRTALLAWYAAHRRALPWRATADPYRIWVSEIMLQQTRVAAVLEHYRRFLEAFPSVAALASATEPEVLALWSGLGYYRRARMLHRAAQVIVAEFAGTMPRTAVALQSLPGVGAYTAAAVASIAFGEAVAVVDGNVERVLARVAGWSAMEKGFALRVRTFAGTLVDPQQASDFNQGMMELGATVCLPRTPLCLHCPWQPWCRTRGEHPMPARRALVRQQSARAVWLRGDGARQKVWLVQRPAEASLMAGMWELPGYEPKAGESPEFTVRHAITVTHHVVDVYVARRRVAAGEGAWVSVGELPQRALTGLTRKVLRRVGCMGLKAADYHADMQRRGWMDPRSAGWVWLMLAALAIGLLTSLLGIGVDHLLHTSRPLYASDILEGAAAFLLSWAVLLRGQRQRRDLLARMQAVEDVNHHVRNALTAVTYSTVLKEDPVLNAIVEDANDRIDWTLRKVLPGTATAFHPTLEERRWCSGMVVDESTPAESRMKQQRAQCSREEW